jgi:hypothetical protein
MAKKKKISNRPIATSSTVPIRAPVILEEEDLPATINIQTDKQESLTEILDEEDTGDRVIKLQVDLLFSSIPTSSKSPFSISLSPAMEYSLIQAAKSSAIPQDCDIKSITVNGLTTVFLSLEVSYSST